LDSTKQFTTDKKAARKAAWGSAYTNSFFVGFFKMKTQAAGSPKARADIHFHVRSDMSRMAA
jgi:hypothetical protein